MLKSLLLMAVLFVAFYYGGALIGGIVALIALIITVYSMLPDIYALIGQRKYVQGNDADGLKWLNRSYNTGRMNTHTAVYYAYILIKNSELDKAQTVTNLMLGRKNIKPDDKTMAKHNLSLIEYRRGNLEDAMEMAQSIFDAGKSTLIYGTLGYYKILHGDADAFDFCKKAVEYNDDDNTILDNYLHVLIQKNMFDDAVQYANKLMDKSPKFVEAYYHSAQIYNALGDKKLASDTLDKTEKCVKTFMTTVTDEQIQALRNEINQ